MHHAEEYPWSRGQDMVLKDLWNARHSVGTEVYLVLANGENSEPDKTIGPAYLDGDVAMVDPQRLGKTRLRRVRPVTVNTSSNPMERYDMDDRQPERPV